MKKILKKKDLSIEEYIFQSILGYNKLKINKVNFLGLSSIIPKISINSNFIKELKKQLINSYYFSFEFFDDNNNNRLILIRMICENIIQNMEKNILYLKIDI